jgi:hypothetical protein
MTSSAKTAVVLIEGRFEPTNGYQVNRWIAAATAG